MEHPVTASSEQSSHKRPRSPSADQPLPAAKIPRTNASQLQINYLARQHQETIPLITVKQQLPELLRLIGEYDGVLQRHESMAGNLGACPLGPILLKRFERLFDGPPRILKSHGRDANVTWLDVVEFAQSKREQFNLEKMRNGVRVCQFYTKQCRVEISEEDFVLIKSGMPQKLIPPQPILEDEEKELAVLDLLDRNLGQVIHLADQVSARARQLIHKMKNRRTAILARREAESDPPPAILRSNDAPLSPAEVNGIISKPVRSIELSQSPPQGFIAVNIRQSGVSEVDKSIELQKQSVLNESDLFPSTSTQNVTYINGRSIKGASPSQRAELMKEFLSPNERPATGQKDAVTGLTDEETRQLRKQSLHGHRTSISQTSTSEAKPQSGSTDVTSGSAHNGKPSTGVAIPSTPAALLPISKPSPLDRDDGGPFKSEMVFRMESMQRGERVMPPCDRCRRLHMDCLKNLTACMGCTKKHAKCSWKDVRMEELQGNENTPDGDPATNTEKDDVPATSVGSTVEMARLVEESMRPQTANTTVSEMLDQSERALMESASSKGNEEAKARSPTFSKPESSEPLSSLGKFDVRPPPLDASHRRSPSQPTHRPIYSPSDSRRSVDFNDHDEGDRLQALAAQVYRSASQSVKPQD